MNRARREKKPSDDIPRRMLVLLLELLKSTAALASALDVCGVAMAQMQAIESRGDWVVSPVLCIPTVPVVGSGRASPAMTVSCACPGRLQSI